MKEHEYKLLEELLGKLRSELGFTYCLVPDFVQDGYYIGQYNKDGKNIRSESSYDLKSLVDKYKKSTTK